MGKEVNKVRDNLIAARALIDTEEKWASIGKSHSAAIYKVTQNWADYSAAEEAYAAIRLRGVGYNNVLATFDRAIEVAE